MKPTSYIENKVSILLSDEENEQVFKLVGYKCLTLATTVVQLFATEGPDCMQWVKRDAGVLCLIRDTNKRSYFFRIFCLVRNKMIWEHEVYNDIQYLAPRPFLHTFEGEERIIAFNFANQSEAAVMRNILLEKLKAKERKRQGRKYKNQRNPCNSLNAAPARPAPTPNSNTMSNGFVQSRLKSSKSRNSGKKSKKKSISKGDIGIPLNFQHVAHVGFNKDMGFEMDNIDDPMMRQFFVKAGISENDLKDKETLEYIYDFIEQHGGYDAVKQNIQLTPPSPPPPPRVPSRNAPCKPPAMRLAPPPQPPLDIIRTERMHPAPPPPPIDPPPPNVIIQKNYDISKKTDAISKPDVFKRAQPPPLPPIPPASTPINSTVSQANIGNAASQNSVPDTRSALMESIRSGTSLKHVEISSKQTLTVNSRDDLLSQIRQGVELKSVPVPPVSKTQHRGTDLASALARALAERKERMYSDSSASSESDDSDHEWDD